jgi:hypothetical protein
MEACISEFNEYSGNLLTFNLPIIFPSRTTEEAYTLWDYGASHKIVNPEFVDQVCDGDTKIKSRRCAEMLLTTAGLTERFPLKEVRLTLDLGKYHYTGWFVVYKLAKYDIILGKNWMQEVGHHVDLQWIILWLGQTAPGDRLKHRLDGLARNKGGPRIEGTTMAALAKPVPTVLEDTANMEHLDGNLAATAAQYEKLMTVIA